MPQTLLRREQTLALHVRAFNLPVVDGGVDAAPDVHFHICAQWRPVACERVDEDFCCGDALGEVEEHLACVLLAGVGRVGTPDVADLGRLVEAVGGEVDAVEVRGVCEFFHSGFGAEFLAVGLETLVDLDAGVVCCVAVQIGGR